MFGHSCAGNRMRPRSLKFSITRGHYFGQIFAMYLLAKFRELRAYVSLVKIVSSLVKRRSIGWVMWSGLGRNGEFFGRCLSGGSL
jgi:hypothetical protein